MLRIHHHPGLDIKRGDTVRVISGGGGGWGNPDDRKTECVLADIADGLISPEAARADYGIEAEAVA